jgi:hypothetical protein
MAAGGPSGFHTREFTVAARDYSPTGSAVTLTYTSLDGEEVCVCVCARVCRA